MIFLERKDIDTALWNKRIAESTTENIFCYTWYLDAVAENWGALVSKDYHTIFPVCYTIKLGIKRIYQAPFTREYDKIGEEFTWEDVWQKIKDNFSHIDFRNSTVFSQYEKTDRKHQYLTLSSKLKDDYSSNAKRLIKKGNKQFSFNINNSPVILIDLFKHNVAHKITAFNLNNLTLLKQLMLNAIKNEHGEMIAAYSETGEMVAAGFFLKDKKRITYLKGAATEGAKKNGAMYALMDFAIDRYQNNYEQLDFGGSDIENVATFYKKFGASDRTYYSYTLDQTPFWFKLLKKIKH